MILQVTGRLPISRRWHQETPAALHSSK